MGFPLPNSTTTLCEVENDTQFNDPAFYKVSTALSVITCGPGLPLNIYVVWLMIRGVGSSIESEFFFLNLALTDILFFTSYLLSPFLRFCPEPLMAAMGFFFGFLFVGHPLFQMCICVERYLAVLHPVLFQRYRALTYRAACSAAVWLVALSCCVSSFLLDEVVWDSLWQTLLWILFPFMIFSCLAVMRALQKPGPGARVEERAAANQVKVRAFRIISLMTLTQFLTLVAHTVRFCVPLLLENEVESFTMYSIVIPFNMCLSFVQPLLLLNRAGKLPCTAKC